MRHLLATLVIAGLVICTFAADRGTLPAAERKAGEEPPSLDQNWLVVDLTLQQPQAGGRVVLTAGDRLTFVGELNHDGTS